MSDLLNDMFWLITGGLVTVIMLKSVYTCTYIFGVNTCVSHQFNLMSAFGL